MKNLNIFIALLILVVVLPNINGFHTTEGITKKKELQQAFFKVITAVAYRNAQENKTWCGENKVAGGRTYEWAHYKGVASYLLDFYVMLQFDSECDTQVLALKDLIINQDTVPIAFNQNSSWWENEFLPKALDAFTCGFTGSKMVDHDFVSHDLRENFDSDLKKQKVWYLVEDYMLGIYHQRENNNRRLDFDVGLYVPFLDTLTSGHYTRTQQMRVGFPTWFGRSYWLIFHTIAQRISDAECTDTVIYEDLVTRLKSFIMFFGNGGIPCPFCLFHFSYHVSMNDRYAVDQFENEATRYYPIEYLLLGGYEGTLASKIASINSTDKHSPALFFWKLHNAVSSSVEMGCSCFTEEIEDVSPFNCVFNSNSLTQASYPRMGRVYPFSKRFEFILTENHNYTIFDIARQNLESTIKNITSLDSLSLRKDLWLYWNNATALNQQTLDTIKTLTDKIQILSNDFIKLEVLKQYSYDIPLNCSKLLESTESLKNTKTKLLTPTEVPHKIPEACKEHPEVSACDKQYPTKAPIITEEEKQTEAPDSSSPSLLIKLNTFILISVLLSILLL